jgi:hypothetical protein
MPNDMKRLCMRVSLASCSLATTMRCRANQALGTAHARHYMALLLQTILLSDMLTVAVLVSDARSVQPSIGAAERCGAAVVFCAIS